jgi:hypothetical protein
LPGVLKKDYPDFLFTIENIRKVREQGEVFHGKRRGGTLRRLFGL